MQQINELRFQIFPKRKTIQVLLGTYFKINLKLMKFYVVKKVIHQVNIIQL